MTSMSYDPEKYKDKRGKVLGIRRRTLGFGALCVIVGAVIAGGLAVAALPGAVDYLSTRNLDDAIFKLDGGAPWPDTALQRLRAVHGIDSVQADTHGSRLIVTFDRTHLDIQKVTALFSADGLTPTLLNRVSHRQRMTMEKQEAMLE
jgi:hypothetical protein